jgi:predicted DNA-binding transcriptional regulator YafY
MGVFASSRTPYTVELLIDNEIGTFALERQWHDSQTVEQREDGSVYVKFTTTQMPEVLRWVLGQGHTVKALNPPERGFFSEVRILWRKNLVRCQEAGQAEAV